MALAVAVGGCLLSTAGTTVSFELLGDLPGGSCCSEALDVNADGSVVVGRSGSDNYFSAFRYQNGVLTALADNGPDQVILNSADSISADGSVIAGTGVFGDGYPTKLTVYSMAGGDLETILPYSYMAPLRLTVGGVSADGDRVVTFFHGPDFPTETYLYQDGEVARLDTGADRINGISADGTVIVGRGCGPTCFQEALIYKDGATTWLGNLLQDGTSGYSEAFAASADGSVVVGSAAFPMGYQAFVWKDGVMTGLDFLRGAGPCSATALDISADGSVIVGTTEFDEGVYLAVMWLNGEVVFLNELVGDWEDGGEVLSLNDVLDHYGIERGGFSLSRANAISADGTTIVGTGQQPDGTTEAFRLQILDPVDFADANLELAVREALAKPEGPITPEDMESLTTLSATNWEIQKLDGIEYACNLESLYLGNNQISDLAPLANLTSLKCLSLEFNQIKDLGPLAGLTGLNQLDLHDNLIGDTCALMEMYELSDEGDDCGLDVRNNYLPLYTRSCQFRVFNNLKYNGNGGLTIESVPQSEHETIAGKPIRPDQTIDTCTFMGELYVDSAPWVYCTRMENWAYVEEACIAACQGWIYVFDVECMDIMMLDPTSWGWSFCLDTWVYVPAESTAKGNGWVYLVK